MTDTQPSGPVTIVEAGVMGCGWPVPLVDVDADETIVPEQVVPSYPRVRARADTLLRRCRATIAPSLPVLCVRRDEYGGYRAEDLLEARDALRESAPGPLGAR
jgi:hypothetical protein